MTDGAFRRPKCPGREPRATPLSDPLLPENASSGSWQLAQLVPGGLERLASRKIDCPTFSRAVNGGTVCGGIGSTMGGASAGRNASDAPGAVGLEVEPELVSGAWSLHPASTIHEAAQTAAVPQDRHRLLGAAVGAWACEAKPRLTCFARLRVDSLARLGLDSLARLRLESCADQFAPASSGWMMPHDAQDIWPLVWMVHTSRTVLSVRYSVDVQVAGEPGLNCSTM